LAPRRTLTACSETLKRSVIRDRLADRG
jgi:hypothetical protein